MIEDAVETGNSGGACPDLGAFLRFGHRWMSSLGHQGIKLGDVFPGQEFRGDGKRMSVLSSRVLSGMIASTRIPGSMRRSAGSTMARNSAFVRSRSGDPWPTTVGV